MIKKFFKKFKRWVLPTKISVISSIITVPLTIIGYFQLFGNDEIAEKLYHMMQVNLRPNIEVKNAEILNYIDDGKVLVLTLKNYSDFSAMNVKPILYLYSNKKIIGKFDSKNLSYVFSIRGKRTSKIPVVRLEQLENEFYKRYPHYHLYEISLLDKSPKLLPGNYISEPFIVTLKYSSEGGEKFLDTIALQAVFKKTHNG